VKEISLDRIKDLPVMPEVAARVVNLTEGRLEISFKELEAIIKVDPGLTAKILKTRGVKAASYFLNGQALITYGEKVTGIIIRGVRAQDEVKVNKLGAYMKAGSLALEGGGCVIGSELAHKLGVTVGDTISVISPASITVKNVVLPGRLKAEAKAFRVAGLFTSGMYEYDANLVYTGLADAQALLGVGGTASGMSVSVRDTAAADSVKRELQVSLGPRYFVRTWVEMNRNLLSALKLEKTAMFIILTLIVIVASFNIASTIIMTVLEKTKDIGILKAIGATNANVMALFAIQGGVIGVIGTFLGVATGLAACWCLKTYKFITLPPDIYYIDKLPVRIDMADIYLIMTSSILISFVMALYPAYKAARLDPVEALRYE
jgi:lipoprotein-releasing system permease protein